PPFSVSFETTSLHREAAKADIASRSTMAARSVLEERNARTERIVMRKDRSRALRKINGKFLCTPTGFFGFYFAGHHLDCRHARILRYVIRHSFA
ncbi:MAG: hypothetical protein WB803_14190, partial [Pseudolabrys sp.]